jgi:hypothetical protein
MGEKWRLAELLPLPDHLLAEAGLMKLTRTSTIEARMLGRGSERAGVTRDEQCFRSAARERVSEISCGEETGRGWRDDDRPAVSDGPDIAIAS